MAVMVAAGLVLVGQLIRWQVVEHYLFTGWATEHKDEWVIPARRGDIRDRNGHLLATDLIDYNISASPQIISNPAGVAEALEPYLNLSHNELVSLLSSDEPWIPLENNVSQNNGEEVLKLDMVGIVVEPNAKRVYPEGELAAHLLGFVNDNGNGFYGIEGYYDTLLKGKPGLQKGDRSPFGDLIPIGSSHFIPPVSGSTLYLTIDRNVQFIVEQELQKAVRKYKAQGGSVVVLDPNTGAILGMAAYPTYNPNNYGETDESLFADPNVSEQYEPGSVFKILTMAAGLDAVAVGPMGTIYDGGTIEVGGRLIYNWDRIGHGTVDMTDVLAKSLNVGVAQIAVTLGKDRFYTYLKRFGFGQLTEVDLANEGPGTLKTPKDASWHESDLGTNSFGQGIAVTPLQIATAVASVANEGLLTKPYIVRRVVNAEQTTEIQPTIIRRAISENTARILSDMLAEAMDRAESDALLSGYQVAGKTGTAQIPVPGGYHPTLILGSFAGYLPVDDPQVLILVIIDRPLTAKWGSKTAAPTFRRIAEQLVLVLDIPPDEARLTMSQERVEEGVAQ
jgi:cell division protein FtsI (penicillin-binding protein 3)